MELIPFAIVVALFFVLIVLPQRKRTQAAQALQASIRVGDDVMMTAGIYGRIVALNDRKATVEIAPGTEVTVARGAIAQRVTADPAVDISETDAGSEPRVGD